MFPKHLFRLCFVIALLFVEESLQQSSNGAVSSTENPIAGNPGSEIPGSENPGSENPVFENPSTGNPVTENLSPSTGIIFQESNSSTLIQQSSSSCYSNADCYTQFGYNSRCYSGSCICNIGYYPYSFSGYCRKINCFSNLDCTTKQYNTACFSGTCSCNSNTYLNTTSQTCLSRNPQTSCMTNYDCNVRSGSKSRCFGQKCICNVGYRSVNGYCTREGCTSNSDCTLTQPNTRCSYDACVCASNTYLNTSAQTCDSTSKYCSNDFDCNARMGYNSVCYLGSCKCDLGYQLINGKCTQKSCIFDSDCSWIWSNTKCGAFGLCTCDDNSLIDTVSQTCDYYYPDSGTSYTGAYVGFPVGFVALWAFIVGCRVACRTQNRRTVVVRSNNRPRTQARAAAPARARQAPAAQLMPPGYPNSVTLENIQTQTQGNQNYAPPPGYPDAPPPPYTHGSYQPPPPEALSPYPVASGKM